MTKFLVLFKTPVSVMDGWRNTPPEEREPIEKKMQAEWQEWMKANAESISSVPTGVGKTKLVTEEGSSDIQNDVMMYGIVEAESPEAAAKMFENHPHLGIPQASIEVMNIANMVPSN